MNIFVLDTRPLQCARAHCDKHVVKMILETTQLLSTAVHVSSPEPVDGLYKKTHVNHPCAVWARATSGNFYWLSKLGDYLLAEYTYRYGKVHASTPVFERAKSLRDFITPGLLTPFVFVGPDEYSDRPVDEAYRLYYANDKRHIATWTKREVPKWWDEYWT